ncbi:MAG TPA: hypothetical protein VGB30_02515 [bacterium]|jgi:hypothetical protein
MPETSLIVRNSLAKTLWKLEDLRYSGHLKKSPELTEALEWIACRYGEGSYRDVMIAPAKSDFQLKHPTPTNEGTASGANIKHILGEESVHILSYWNYSKHWDRKKTLDMIVRCFRTDSDPPPKYDRPGVFCCATCSIARLRAIASSKPAGWETICRDGLDVITNASMKDSGRWKRFPFYYTLLGLRELNDKFPGQVQPIIDKVRPSVERAQAKSAGKDLGSRFRKHAVDWIK